MAKRIAIVGATGMVGSQALRFALEHPEVERVTAVGRKAMGLAHPKLHEVLHRDFSDCSALAGSLTSHDAVIFCLGAYTGAVSDAELRTITVDCTVEFAKAFVRDNPHSTFAFLSGAGADQTGRSRIAFARYKGEAEKALLESGFSRVYLFRPAYIYPVVPRREPNLGYALFRRIYPVFRVLFPSQVIRADDLGRVMLAAAVQAPGTEIGPIIENKAIRAMVRALVLNG